MAEKCPKCGSKDIGTAYMNYVERGAKAILGFGVSIVTGLTSGNNSHAAHVAHHTLKEIQKPMKSHKCKHCGHEW